MMRLRNVLLLLAATVLSGGSVCAADATPPAPQATANASSELQNLKGQFKARRDALLADRQALLNQLKTATAEQRKAILEKMEAQRKDLFEAQRALGRQIRDEMRRLRQSPAGTGTR